MHNLYTLRGAEVRDANGWARYITEAQSLFPDAEVVFRRTIGRIGARKPSTNT